MNTYDYKCMKCHKDYAILWSRCQKCLMLTYPENVVDTHIILFQESGLELVQFTRSTEYNKALLVDLDELKTNKINRILGKVNPIHSVIIQIETFGYELKSISLEDLRVEAKSLLDNPEFHRQAIARKLK